MKIQDLRYGNVFILNGAFVKITAIYTDELFWESEGKTGFCTIDSLVPIILKPSLLSYIGFEKPYEHSKEWSNFEWGYKKFGKDFNSMVIELIDYGYCYTQGEGVKLSIPMIYLHHLQNVCYFNTGIEIATDISNMG